MCLLNFFGQIIDLRNLTILKIKTPLTIEDEHCRILSSYCRQLQLIKFLPHYPTNIGDDGLKHFSNLSYLKFLSITTSNIRFHSVINFPKLRTLDIRNCRFLDNRSLLNFLNGCPDFHILAINCCYNITQIPVIYFNENSIKIYAQGTAITENVRTEQSSIDVDFLSIMNVNLLLETIYLKFVEQF